MQLRGSRPRPSGCCCRHQGVLCRDCHPLEQEDGNFFLQACLLPKGDKGHWLYVVPSFGIYSEHRVLQNRLCRNVELCRDGFREMFGVSEDRLSGLAKSKRKQVPGDNPFRWLTEGNHDTKAMYFVTPKETFLSWKHGGWAVQKQRLLKQKEKEEIEKKRGTIRQLF